MRKRNNKEKRRKIAVQIMLKILHQYKIFYFYFDNVDDNLKNVNDNIFLKNNNILNLKNKLSGINNYQESGGQKTTTYISTDYNHTLNTQKTLSCEEHQFLEY